MLRVIKEKEKLKEVNDDRIRELELEISHLKLKYDLS